MDGRITKCVVNTPESIHDSTFAAWGYLYDDVDSVFHRLGLIYCVASAFSAESYAKLKSGRNVTTATNLYEVEAMRQAKSLRQASEMIMVDYIDT